MQIGGVDIDKRTLVIAEVGSNHCGDMDLARRSVLAAAECGADVVKFQMYDPDQLVDPTMPVLSYIAQTHRTQRERFRSLSLPRETFPELADLATRAKILFMVTPFYEGAVDFLNPLMPAFKIASGDLTHLRLLRAVSATGKPVLLSTGMATTDEIDQAVREVPRERLVLLHCVGAYPTPDEEVNLAVISYLRDRYGVPVGWSDHTRGTAAAVAAVAVGAQVIEKHFILSKDLPAADVELSSDPSEFRNMVDTIRRIERMHGSPEKRPTPSEAYFREKLRRAVYAARDLVAGEVLRMDDVILLRPFVPGGISAQNIEGLEGRRLITSVRKHEVLLREFLEN
jgi:sialic acid synthase SpsE